MTPQHVFFLFLDGVGLGTDDATYNPFFILDLPTFSSLTNGHAWTQSAPEIATAMQVFRPIAATLGIDGLPQSGTGQASLFTGVNCAERAGRHFGPYPHSTSKPIIAEQNVFQRAKALNKTVAFANAYPERFFRFVKKRNRWTVTTLCCVEAEVPLRTHADLENKQAITADLTGAGWQRLGYAFTPITENAAGQIFAHIGHQYDFTLFEYYLTDKAGHSQSLDRAAPCLHAVDRFLAGFLDAFDPATDLLLLTSDHGNLEDLSTKTHTRNAVPFLAYGTGASAFSTVQNLTDVVPTLMTLFAPKQS